MKRRVSDLKPGDRIAFENPFGPDVIVTLDQVHNFDELPVGNGAHTPACTLLIFGAHSVSFEQHIKVTLCKPS